MSGVGAYIAGLFANCATPEGVLRRFRGIADPIAAEAAEPLALARIAAMSGYTAGLTTDHHIKLTLESNGRGVSAVFTCTAGPDADCRNHCEECDPEYGCREYAEHRAGWVPSGVCNPTEWISNDDAGWCELYGGTGDTDARSGPITLKWEGEYYTWDYATPDDDTDGW